jgi:hypothetical protein
VRFHINSLAAGLLLIISGSCSEKGAKYIDQGEVHYNIEYLRSSGTMPVDLKPKTLVVSFRKDKILFEILSPIGNQGIMNIINPESEIYDTYVNMLGIRYYYAGSSGEMYPGFGSMEGAEIKKTSRNTLICGYNCKNAEVTFPFDRSRVYNFWYTNEIKVKNSNISTPFSEIEGVLLSFYYIMGDSELKFEAETVYKKEIPDKAFERRPKFRLVAKKDMDKLITDMVNL